MLTNDVYNTYNYARVLICKAMKFTMVSLIFIFFTSRQRCIFLYLIPEVTTFYYKKNSPFYY